MRNVNRRALAFFAWVVVGACGGCSLFSPIPDSPTKRDRDFANNHLYRWSGEHNYYFRATKEEGYDPSKDVPDAFEDVKVEGKMAIIPGDRSFMIDGWEYCRDVEEHSARASGWWSAIGLPSLAIGIPTAAAGTTLSIAEAAKTTPDSKTLTGSITLAAGGYLLTMLGIFALDRSSAGAAASAEAGRGNQKQTSDEAFKACSDARATWVASRERAIEDVKAERDRLQRRLDELQGDGGAPPDAGPKK